MSESVTEESKTSGEAQPMVKRPAEPTEAQKEAGAEEAVKDGEAVEVDGPSQAALEQVKADAEWRDENPGKVLIRESNPAVGGESFDYLDHIRP